MNISVFNAPNIRTNFAGPYRLGWHHCNFFPITWSGYSNPMAAAWPGFSKPVAWINTSSRCLIVAGDFESSLQMGNMADISRCFVIGIHFVVWNTAQGVVFWSFFQSWSLSNSDRDTLTIIPVCLNFGMETDGKWIGGTSVYHFGRCFSLTSVDEALEKLGADPDL